MSDNDDELTVTKEATQVANKFIDDLENYSDDGIVIGMAYVLSLQLASMSVVKGWSQEDTKRFAAGLFTRIIRQMDKAIVDHDPQHHTTSKTLH